MSDNINCPPRKLVLSDIDGTFISGNSVPPDNYRAVREFEARGNFFTFATGRDERELEIIEPAMKSVMNAPAVMCNGAYIYDLHAGKRLDTLALEPESTYTLLRSIEKRFGRTYTRISIPGRWHHFYDESDEGLLDQPIWFKVIIGGDGGLLDAIKAFVNETAQGAVYCCKSGPTLLEILNPGASKGAMLLRLKKYYENQGIPLRVYAIGDYENDITMLENADRSACPGNASDAVKKIADEVLCDCGEGAVARFLDEIMSENA